jgi:glycosyltransferase involved in cell wall biosynthesis
LILLVCLYLFLSLLFWYTFGLLMQENCFCFFTLLFCCRIIFLRWFCLKKKQLKIRHFWGFDEFVWLNLAFKFIKGFIHKINSVQSWTFFPIVSLTKMCDLWMYHLDLIQYLISFHKLCLHVVSFSFYWGYFWCTLKLYMLISCLTFFLYSSFFIFLFLYRFLLFFHSSKYRPT